MTGTASHRLPIGRATLLLTLGLLLSIAATARADVGTTIIERCTHHESLSGFSQQDYSKALQELPTEVEEYSDCGSLIRRAQLAAAGGSGSGALATALPLTAGERSTLRRAARATPGSLRVGGQIVSPGVVNASAASALSSLPGPLLAILAFLLASALALAGAAIRDRVRSRRSH